MNWGAKITAVQCADCTAVQWADCTVPSDTDQRNWVCKNVHLNTTKIIQAESTLQVFTTNSNFSITISLQADCENPWCKTRVKCNPEKLLYKF